MLKRQNIHLIHTLPALMILTLVSSPAAAQPTDEPYYEHVVEIHIVPPPRRAQPRRQHLDRERPCTACSVAVVHRPAARRAAKVNSGPFVSLDANVGYGAYYWTFGESVNGPVFNGSLSFLWGAGHSRGGFRLTGFYSMAEGEVDHLFGSSNDPASSKLYGGSVMAQGEYKGLWGSTGVGILHVETDYVDSDGYGDSFLKNDSYTLPELCWAAGYNLHLSKNFALRVSGEVGTFFFLSWRASISGGVMVSF
jgi:hypothetical protein